MIVEQNRENLLPTTTATATTTDLGKYLLLTMIKILMMVLPVTRRSKTIASITIIECPVCSLCDTANAVAKKIIKRRIEFLIFIHHERYSSSSDDVAATTTTVVDMDNNNNTKSIKDNIDFILSHFEHQHELFPRTIMTAKTDGQIKIEYESDSNKIIQKILNHFHEANYKDYRINSFPF